MNAFEQMYWPVWINLQDNEKLILMRQVLMYFVSPLSLVKDVQLEDFDLGGVKCRTFTFTIDGEPFVFVPGQNEVVLGWDQGTEGLSLRDILASEAAFTYLEHLPKPQIPSAEELAQTVNANTSQLRKVDVEPMIVSRYATPFGTRYIGDFETITGIFKGEVDTFSPLESRIRKIIYPQMTAEESLAWEFPKNYFEENGFYLELDPATSSYHVYLHEAQSLADIRKKLRRRNFTMPTEDEYEYLVGAGTRRLFFWGNRLNFFDGQYISPSFAQVENMFGLKINIDRLQYQLLSENNLVKAGPINPDSDNLMAALLPLSPYFRKEVELTPTDILPSLNYSYRKITRVHP